MALIKPMSGAGVAEVPYFSGNCNNVFAWAIPDWKPVLESATSSEPVVKPFPNGGFELVRWIESETDQMAPEVKLWTTEVVGQLKDRVYEHKIKAPGSYKDFEEQKAKGIIVVKPLYNAKVRVKDRYVASPATDWTHACYVTLYQTTGAGGIYPCFSSPTLMFKDTGNLPGPQYTEWEAKRLGGAVLEFQYSPTAHAVPLSTLVRLPSPVEINNLILAQVDRPPPGLVNQALDEINSGAYDLLTELGELPETISYVYSTLRRIIQAFLLVKSKEAAARKKFKGAELIDELTSLWMQFRYAVGPMAYSVADILEYMNVSNRGYVTARKREDVPFEIDLGDGFTMSGDIEHRVFAKLRVDLTNQTRNLGLNPAKTLWELTPLSFVVGWVLPIGDILGALVPPSSALQTATTHSVRIRKVKLIHEEYGSVDVDVDIYQNNIINPSVDWRILPDVSMNWKRTLDALSLSWMLFIKPLWKSRQ